MATGPNKYYGIRNLATPDTVSLLWIPCPALSRFLLPLSGGSCCPLLRGAPGSPEMLVPTRGILSQYMLHTVLRQRHSVSCSELTCKQRRPESVSRPYLSIPHLVPDSCIYKGQHNLRADRYHQHTVHWVTSLGMSTASLDLMCPTNSLTFPQACSSVSLLGGIYYCCRPGFTPLSYGQPYLITRA